MVNNNINFNLDENVVFHISVRKHRSRNARPYECKLAMVINSNGKRSNLVIENLHDLNSAFEILEIEKISNEDLKTLTEYIGGRTDNEKYKSIKDESVVSFGHMSICPDQKIKFVIGGNFDYDDFDGTFNSDEIRAETIKELLVTIREKEAGISKQ